MKLSDETKQLRAEVAALHPGRGRKYPAELRWRILGWVDRELAAGSHEAACGLALGIPSHRFEEWRRRERERDADAVSATLVPVEVSGALAAPLTLTTPSGFRIEGLTLADAIAILRALR
jgi:hypothetical protein